MAPKAVPKVNKEADKARQKAKAKAAEDKTFGLKNKNKSAKVAKYVQCVTQNSGVNAKDKRLQEQAEKAKKEKKEAEERRKQELNELFAMAIKQPKVPAGVDPKSVVCEFFRHGQCTKGFKCKFSHDLGVERKTAKIDLFTDQRDLDKEGGDEGMEDWDQATLESVVAQKHGAERPSNTTSIICKFFLDAVEKRQYGWFWRCPNGGDCKYRHALPPGYVLKSQMKELLEAEAAKNSRDITEVIEEERSRVEGRTPITEEVFRGWHARKRDAREAQRATALEERRKKGLLNGREIFLQDNFVATDDAAAGGDDEYKREDDEEARIEEMFRAAAAAQAAARAAVDAGPSTAGADEEDAALFGGGSDDDGECPSSDDDGGEELSDGELDALEAQLKGTAVG